MRVCLLLAVALPLVAPLPLRAQPFPAATPAATDFSHLILQRLAAASRGDTTGYRQFFAEGAVVVVEDGTRNSLDEVVARVAREAAATQTHSGYEIKDVHVVRDGSFVMVDYLMIELVPAGPRSLTFRFRALDLFVPRAGSWRVLRHVHTSATATPPPVAIDVAKLQDYVGRYEWWPGYVDTITCKGTELYSQMTGEQKATLSLAATPESFFFAGEAPLLVFIRDQSGRVSHYLLHWGDGQVTLARRLP